LYKIGYNFSKNGCCLFCVIEQSGQRKSGYAAEQHFFERLVELGRIKEALQFYGETYAQAVD
jgi:hypothetical protein